MFLALKGRASLDVGLNLVCNPLVAHADPSCGDMILIRILVARSDLTTICSGMCFFHLHGFPSSYSAGVQQGNTHSKSSDPKTRVNTQKLAHTRTLKLGKANH